MSPVILPPPLKITKEQRDGFIKSVAITLIALDLNDFQQVYLFHDRSVVVSFSGDYQPFICYKMSYNDPSKRFYINQHTFILDQIAEALDAQGRDIPGGRVFIEKEYSYIKDGEYRHNVILLLDWQGFDPYDDICSTHDFIKNDLMGQS